MGEGLVGVIGEGLVGVIGEGLVGVIGEGLVGVMGGPRFPRWERRVLRTSAGAPGRG
jgi:hypothetical protein